MSKSPRLIAVVGATGQQGGAVVRALQASRQFKVRALTRNPSQHPQLGNEVVLADFNRPETLKAAFAGAHGVFLVTNAWEAGADEFLSKPVHPLELRARVNSLTRMKHLFDALDSAEAAFMTLALTIEARDPTTGGHCERLARHAVALGKALGVDEKEVQALHRGGYLHDVGKVGVPDAVLLKPGPLTTAEFALMKKHPDIGDSLFSASETGPLWYRGLASEPESSMAPTLDVILERMKSRAIVIGHTTVAGKLTPRLGGRVILIDTGMVNGEFYPGGVASALELQGNKATAIYLDRREPLATPNLVGAN